MWFFQKQAKKNYEQKCRDQDSCEEILKKSASNLSSKDEEKVIHCNCMTSFSTEKIHNKEKITCLAGKNEVF
jgi:hypothetical protein